MRNLPMVAVCALILVGNVVAWVYNPARILTDHGADPIYTLSRLTPEGWEPIKLPPDCNCRSFLMLKGTDGTISLNNRIKSIYRYGDGSWQPPFNGLLKPDHLSVPLFFDDAVGDQLWGAQGREVVFYDGDRWTRYENTLIAGDIPERILIAGERTFVSGAFSLGYRSGDADWITTHYDDLLEGDPVEQFGITRISMAAAPDGSVWLANGGLYRSARGNTWNLIRSIDGTDAYTFSLIGADDRSAWVLMPDRVEQVDLEGQTIQSFTFNQIGIRSGEQPFITAAGDGQVALGTIEAVYLYDGQSWQRAAQNPQLGTVPYPRLNFLDFDVNGVLWTSYVSTFTNLQQYEIAVTNPLIYALRFLSGYVGLILIPAADLLFRYLPKWLIERRYWLKAQQVLGISVPENASSPYSLMRGLRGGVITVFCTGGAIVLATGVLSGFTRDRLTGSIFDRVAYQSALVSPGLIASICWCG